MIVGNIFAHRAHHALERGRIGVRSPDPASFQRVMRSMGKYVADDHLNTLYKAFLRFCVSPNAVLDYQERIWPLYFRGIDAEVIPGKDRRGGEVIVKKLGNLRH